MDAAGVDAAIAAKELELVEARAEPKRLATEFAEAQRQAAEEFAEAQRQATESDGKHCDKGRGAKRFETRESNAGFARPIEDVQRA